MKSIQELNQARYQDLAHQPMEEVSKDLLNQQVFSDGSILPKVMRVTKIWREGVDGGYPGSHYIYRAVLFAQGVQIAVQWIPAAGELLMMTGSLVTITYKELVPYSDDGYLHIKGLVRLDRPEGSYNLFATAPPEWFLISSLLKDLQALWELLADRNRLLLNAVLFDGAVFRRFCEGPSSVNHHHNYPNGNLEHTLEVVHIVIDTIKHYKTANLELAMMFAWLHDIGKADEYRIASESAYKLSQEGYFHGHKMNGLNMVVKAQATYTPSYPPKTFNHLRHLLEASESNNASGLRKPQMQEYAIVHHADVASVLNNLYSRSFDGKPYGVGPEDQQGWKMYYRYEF